MKIIVRVLINAVALWFATFVPGIKYTGIGSLLGIALVFGIVNALIRPVLKLISFPIVVLTLGLFTLVINALMLMLSAWFGRKFGLDFYVNGFLAAFVGSIVVTIVSTALSFFVHEKA